MKHTSDYDPLPEDLELHLRSMGGAVAPAELEDRVVLARLGQASAPLELWDRVEMAVFGKAQAPEGLWSAIQPEVQRASRRTRVFRFPKRLAAAAAIMLAVGIGVGISPWTTSEEDSRVAEYAALKEETRSQFMLIEVQPEELSPAASGFAGSVGGAFRPGGSL